MIHNLTLTGDGTTKTLAALMLASGNYASPAAAGKPDPNTARPMWLQGICESGGIARIGDVNTSVSYGSPIPSAYGGQLLPSVYQEGHLYSFTSIYLYVPLGATVSLMWDA